MTSGQTYFVTHQSLSLGQVLLFDIPVGLVLTAAATFLLLRKRRFSGSSVLFVALVWFAFKTGSFLQNGVADIPERTAGFRSEILLLTGWYALAVVTVLVVRRCGHYIRASSIKA